MLIINCMCYTSVSNILFIYLQNINTKIYKNIFDQSNYQGDNNVFFQNDVL